MATRPTLRHTIHLLTGAAALALGGCQNHWTNKTHWTENYNPPVIQPLGTQHDQVMRMQEETAERGEFVFYQHEFVMDSEFLNTDGEDHLKQVAARLGAGQNVQVIVERSRNSARPDTVFKYRVHPNPQLDMRRREVVVRCLAALGVQDAEQRVAVAPDPWVRFRQEDLQSDGDNAGGGGFGGFFFGR